MNGEMSKTERISYIREQINQLESEAHRVFMDMEKIPEWAIDGAEEHYAQLKYEISAWYEELTSIESPEHDCQKNGHIWSDLPGGYYRCCVACGFEG